jgi:hypothetical protein
MSVRRVVQDFVELGPLPSEAFYLAHDSDELQADLDERERRLKLITPPVTDEEAHLLANSLGPDLCFGLGWTLVHLIETAPSPVAPTQPPADANELGLALWRRISGK